MCAFDWHQDSRPWMALNCYKYCTKFLGISQIWKVTMAKRM